MKIGKRIKGFRKDQKITQHALGKKLGWSNNDISLIERGKRKPGFEDTCRILRALGFEVIIRKEVTIG